MLEDEARASLVGAVRALERSGLNQGSSGNVSMRWQDGALITPTGASGETLVADAIVNLGLDGVVRGGGIPSSEWEMHTEILRAFPAAGAVVHTHADACVALSCLRQPIPPFHYMLASFGGNDIRCADYAPFGSSELARAAVAALSERKACLLANHGMIVWANDIRAAVASANKLETLARQYILARQAGSPVMLDSVEMDEVRKRYVFYGVAPMPRTFSSERTVEPVMASPCTHLDNPV